VRARSTASERRAVHGAIALARLWNLGDVDASGLWRAANDEIAARLLLAAAREQLVEARERGDGILVVGVVVPLASTHALELHAAAIGGAHPPLPDVLELWDRVARGMGCDDATTSRIADELDDGRSKLVLAELAARTQPRLRAALPAEDPRRHDAEHFVTRGHPWHPMAKTRLGLGWADNVRLAPELCARAAIDAVEVPLAQAQRFGSDSGLAVAGVRWDRTTIRLPILRAQWRRLAPALRARLHRVEMPPTIGRSLASLRTIALDDPGVHLKLALDVLTTSARRTVSPMSVANATRVSALLEQIQGADPIAAGTPRLSLMREVAAAGLDPSVFGPDARHVGVIVRDAAVIDHENIVCAALGERDADGALFLDRLLAGYDGLPAERADRLVVDYTEQLVPPVLRLWTGHGIALEPHMQNTLVRAVHGRPRGFVVRDLGGIRVHRPRLDRAGHAIAFAPGSFIATDDEDEARDKLVHALVHAHLAPLLRELVRRCGYDERRGWMRIGDVMDAHLRAWSGEAGLADAALRDRVRIFAPRVRAKALLRMRIVDRSSEYRYVELDNPLARPVAPIDQPNSAT